MPISFHHVDFRVNIKLELSDDRLLLTRDTTLEETAIT